MNCITEKLAIGSQSERQPGRHVDVLMPHQVNVPIVFKGVSIFPGDYIYAQRDIAVVIPGSKVAEVFEEAISIEKDDAKFIEMIKGEDPKKILQSGSHEA